MAEPKLSVDDVNTFFSIVDNVSSVFNSLPIDDRVKQIFLEELAKNPHILIPSLFALGAGVYLLVKEELDEVDEYHSKEEQEKEKEKKLMKELALTGISIALIVGGTVGTSMVLHQLNQNIQQRLSQLGGGDSTGA
jgi:hypothetical protein